MKAFLLYMIGPSGSGKTTIATKLSEELKKELTIHFQYIDGDIIREEIGNIFGYGFEERMKNNRVVCVVANYLLRNGISVILTQVAGYQAMREQVQKKIEGEYIEIYIKCSIDECARRDVKGYYKMAKDGGMDNLNGTNAIFEEPLDSDLVINTELTSVNEAVKQIIALLKMKEYL